MNVTENIYYVGVNDHKIDLFEGQYPVSNGMAYNSYIIMDEKIAIMDTVDINFTDEWLENIKKTLNGKKPDYLIIQHMEPDHSSNIINLLNTYPETILVGNPKTFLMIEQFFHTDIKNKLVVKDNDILSLGNHELKFIFAPMVHWPEVMLTYEINQKILFSADAFGKFGALDKDEDWDDEARRYYFGIVGKYGKPVQALLKKASSLEINMICPLHGPVLSNNLNHYIDLYDKWSKYESEDKGVLIAYASVYGNTKKAALLLKEKLEKENIKVSCYDLARDDMTKAISDAFKYQNIILASITYNASVFPYMNTFISHLVERNLQNKNIGIIENSSWAPMASKTITNKLSELSNIFYFNSLVSIKSSLNDDNIKQIDDLVLEIKNV